MKIKNILLKHQKKFARVINLDSSNFFVFDLTKKNNELNSVNVSDVNQFNTYVDEKLKQNNTQIGIGQYNENRTIYDHSNVFSGETRRTIHLGIDLWVKPETKIFAPILGKVHSFQFNNNVGDYGPTIILEHDLEGIQLYTLYGHLSLDSLENIKVGQIIEPGQEFARVGNFPINGNWPPHLHFQVMTNILGKKGDFPGVCSEQERERMLDICLDPNLVLGIETLN
jgi:peptidoglycan LD-endopeptidase LytH